MRTCVLLGILLMATNLMAGDSYTAPSSKESAATKKVGGSTKNLLEQYDKAIAPYVAEARATYPAAKRRFLGWPRVMVGRDRPDADGGFGEYVPTNWGSQRVNTFFVRIRLKQADKIEEPLIQVTSIEVGEITGIITGVKVVTNYKKGQKITVPESEIKDWVIRHSDGTEEGNVVGKFLKRSRIAIPTGRG